MRLSGVVRTPDKPSDSETLSVRRAILWLLVGAALLLGLVLYFKYEPLIQPLLG